MIAREASYLQEVTMFRRDTAGIAKVLVCCFLIGLYGLFELGSRRALGALVRTHILLIGFQIFSVDYDRHRMLRFVGSRTCG
jgi:hypothetical protein